MYLLPTGARLRPSEGHIALPGKYDPTPCWTRRLGKGGYVSVKLPLDHPMAHKAASGWVAEHRVVMAGMIGRPLKRGENVHHLDGDRANNAPGNLELWVVRQPKGQRATEALHCPGCCCFR